MGKHILGNKDPKKELFLQITQGIPALHHWILLITLEEDLNSKYPSIKVPEMNLEQFKRSLQIIFADDKTFAIENCEEKDLSVMMRTNLILPVICSRLKAAYGLYTEDASVTT